MTTKQDCYQADACPLGLALMRAKKPALRRPTARMAADGLDITVEQAHKIQRLWDSGETDRAVAEARALGILG